MSERPPPGYYPDPEDASRRRWWDGVAWGPLAPAALDPRPVDATAVRSLIEQERRGAPMAAAAITVGIVLYLMVNVASLFTIDDTRAQFEALKQNVSESVDASNDGRAAELVEPAVDAPLASSVQSLASMLLIGVAVIFIRWNYRVAQSARALGLSDWAPAWAIFGWVIPLAALVLPYLVMRAAVPSHHPTRVTIKRWWSAWIALQLAGTILAFVPLLLDVQMSVLITTSVVYAVIVGAAGFAARSVIVEVGAVHHELTGVS